MPENDFEGEKKKTHRKKHAGMLNDYSGNANRKYKHNPLNSQNF